MKAQKGGRGAAKDNQMKSVWKRTEAGNDGGMKLARARETADERQRSPTVYCGKRPTRYRRRKSKKGKRSGDW